LHEQPPPIRERPAPALREARTADGGWWRRWSDLPRGLAIGAAGGLFLSVTGAFETGAAPLGQRTLYWVGLCTGGSLVGTAVTAAAVRLGGLGPRRWLLGALTAAVLTLVLTPAVWLVTDLMFNDRPHPSRLPGFLWPVAVITAVMTAITFALNQPLRATHAAPAPLESRRGPGAAAASGHAARAEPEAARFLQRLPPKLRGARLWAVESEDHYLRLHTSRGQDLILMRLSDALAELEGLEGAQTHRSWWVARDGYETAERADGRAVLKLKSGAEAPVSRTYARALRAAGWF
jgi:hypothetical protein